MIAPGCSVVYHHTVFAHQTVDQRLDIDRAKPHLAVADNDAGLYDIARHDFLLEPGVYHLDIHSVLCDLAALKPCVRYFTNNR